VLQLQLCNDVFNPLHRQDLLGPEIPGGWEQLMIRGETKLRYTVVKTSAPLERVRRAAIRCLLSHRHLVRALGRGRQIALQAFGLVESEYCFPHLTRP
jgi:hypothetical protein